jgi:HAD superfamily hydrolase (TIGR01490 family)
VQGIAFFDFDGTLVKGDSLLPFLAEIAGRRQVRWSLAHALKAAVEHRARRGRVPGAAPDLRTVVKETLIRHTLSGVPVEEARAAASRLAGWPRWNRRVVDQLRRHRDQGRRIVVATGALELYMPSLLAGLGVDDLLATGLEAVDGVLTGRMAGGNCVRLDKARRVAAYLRERGPFGESWGYGNRPSDLPMLSLLIHRTVV